MDLGCNPKRPTEPWSLALTLTPGSLHRGPKGSSTSANAASDLLQRGLGASLRTRAGSLTSASPRTQLCHPCPRNAGFICLSALAEHLFLYSFNNTVSPCRTSSQTASSDPSRTCCSSTETRTESSPGNRAESPPPPRRDCICRWGFGRVIPIPGGPEGGVVTWQPHRERCRVTARQPTHRRLGSTQTQTHINQTSGKDLLRAPDLDSVSGPDPERKRMGKRMDHRRTHRLHARHEHNVVNGSTPRKHGRKSACGLPRAPRSGCKVARKGHPESNLVSPPNPTGQDAEAGARGYTCG